MSKFTLTTIKKELYKYHEIFGKDKKTVVVQNESDSNKADLVLKEFGLFDSNKEIWKEYLENKYTNDAYKYNNCDFILVHFANIQELLTFVYGNKKNIKETRSKILNGNEGRCDELRRDICSSLYSDYENRTEGFGDKINAVIEVNKFVILNYCKDIFLLSERINYLIDVCEKDDSFPWDNANKDIFLSHIKAYSKHEDELCIDKKEWCYDLSYILSWLLLAALLRFHFSKFAKIIPDKDVDVLLRSQREYIYLKNEFDKYIKKELNDKLKRSNIKEINDDFLLTGIYSNDVTSYKTSLSELLKKSWVSKDEISKNIYIVGEGGIGKTISVLYMVGNDEYNINGFPALYIPLNKLGGFEQVSRDGQYFEIEKNIAWYITKNYPSQNRYIESISSIDTDDSLKMILVLDGFNEINTNYQYQILRDIKNWEHLPAVQVIVTSRSLPDYKGSFDCFVADCLSREIIGRFLLKSDIENIENKDALSTPLLLQLCCETERAKKYIDSEYIKQLDWSDVNNAGDVFWNYLQYEIYRCIEKHTYSGDNLTRLSDYYYFVLQLCPYLAWKMTNDQLLHLEESKLEKWVGDAFDYLELEKNIYDEKIKKIDRKSGYILDDRNRDIKIGVFIQLLENLNVLMNKNVDEEYIEYSLMHQNIRDYLTAVFINNVLYKDLLKRRFLSSIVTKVQNPEILIYLSNIMKDEDINILWQSIKIHDIPIDRYRDLTYPHAEYDIYYFYKNIESKIMIKRDYLQFWEYRRSVVWFLRFFGIIYNNDYSLIDFSNMDLTYISLADCRKEGSCQLKLSQDSNCFKNTKISPYTFKKICHNKKVNTVCVIHELNICVSGDSEGKAYAWDLNNNKFLFLLDCCGMEIFDIKYYNTGSNYYLAVCSDKSIDLFELNSSTVYDDNYNWISPFFSTEFSSNNYFSRRSKISRALSFYFDGDLYIYYTSSKGEVGRYNISKNAFEPKLLCDEPTNINKIELFNFQDNIYCASANEDFSVDIWNVTNNGWKKRITVKEKKIVDDFSYIEESASSSRNMWNNKLTGITDLKVINNNGKIDIVFADSNGGVHITHDVTNDGVRSSLLGRHKKCVNKILYLYGRNWIITCSNDNTIIRWDIRLKKRVGKVLNWHKDWVIDILQIDNNKVVSFGHDNKVFVWNIVEDEAYDIPTKTIDWILCGEIYTKYDDYCLVTGDASGSVVIWNINEKRKVHTFKGYIDEILDIMAFKRGKNSYLAVASADGIARIWDLKTYRCVSVLEGHVGWINAIKTCCNGNCVITCGSDMTVRIFDIKDFDNPKSTVLKGHSDWVLDVDIISDNNKLKFATSSYDGTFVVWENSFNTYKAIRVGKPIKDDVNYSKDNKVEFKYNDADVHKAGIKIIKVLGSNLIATGGYDRKVVLWKLDNIIMDKGRVLENYYNDWVSTINTLGELDDRIILSSSVDGKISVRNYDDLSEKKDFLLCRNPYPDFSWYINDYDYSLHEEMEVKNGELIESIDKIEELKDGEYIALTSIGDLIRFKSNNNNIKDNLNQRLDINQKYKMEYLLSENALDSPGLVFLEDFTVIDSDKLVVINKNNEFGVYSICDSRYLILPDVMNIILENTGDVKTPLRLSENEEYHKSNTTITDDYYNFVKDDYSDYFKTNEIDNSDYEEQFWAESWNSILKKYDNKYIKPERKYLVNILQGLSVKNLNFSKAIFSNKELKAILQQNGAIVQ